MLFAGDTIDGGHCCLFYKPDYYPLNWVILDWCYRPDKRSIESRNVYDVKDDKVYGYSRTTDGGWSYTDKRYIQAWFWFNENKTTFSLTRRF
jgi:hypothetical protein